MTQAESQTQQVFRARETMYTCRTSNHFEVSIRTHQFHAFIDRPLNHHYAAIHHSDPPMRISRLLTEHLVASRILLGRAVKVNGVAVTIQISNEMVVDRRGHKSIRIEMHHHWSVARWLLEESLEDTVMPNVKKDRIS